MKEDVANDVTETGQHTSQKKDMNISDLSPLEQLLHYQFKNIGLLEEALRHSSFVNEQDASGMRDNERLEFLGDAVINLVVGHLLMDRYPYLKEGDLSRTRAGLVNEAQLAEIARKINMGAFIRLGKGERQTDGRDKNSILANTFEAVVAAIYLDGGLDAAFQVVDYHFSMLSGPVAPKTAEYDYKSRLQERVQTQHSDPPLYEVIQETGPDHDKTFSVEVTVCGVCATGQGKSKKLAEQDAARKVFEMLEEKG